MTNSDPDPGDGGGWLTGADEVEDVLDALVGLAERGVVVGAVGGALVGGGFVSAGYTNGGLSVVALAAGFVTLTAGTRGLRRYAVGWLDDVLRESGDEVVADALDRRGDRDLRRVDGSSQPPAESRDDPVNQETEVEHE